MCDRAKRGSREGEGACATELRRACAKPSRAKQQSTEIASDEGSLAKLQQSTEITSDEREPGTVGTARARRFFSRQRARDATPFA
jgi:hypothetical protein